MMRLSAQTAVVAVTVLIAAAAAMAHAQDRPANYPLKPIRVIVGIAPGGGLDGMVRLGAQKVSERWGQTVIVDNRPGGGTVLAMDMAAQAVPDGYTLLGASDTLMMNGVLKRAAYDVRSAFIPIVQVTTQPYTLVVHPALPVKTVKDLIVLARARPEVLTYGSQGLGTTGHIGWERFNLMAGTRIVHVPYKGAAPALVDVIAGQIQMTMSIVAATAPYIRNGKLRGLAYTGMHRSTVLPELPTVNEAGVPGFYCHNTYGFAAPAGTPAEIVLALNRVIALGVNAPATVKTLAAGGNDVVPPATPEEYRARFNSEYAALEKLIGALNIKIN